MGKAAQVVLFKNHRNLCGLPQYNVSATSGVSGKRSVSAKCIISAVEGRENYLTFTLFREAPREVFSPAAKFLRHKGTQSVASKSIYSMGHEEQDNANFLRSLHHICFHAAADGGGAGVIRSASECGH